VPGKSDNHGTLPRAEIVSRRACLGRGERLFAGVERTDLVQVGVRHTDLVTHVRYEPVRPAAAAA
jgi:hypothetical protein